MPRQVGVIQHVIVEAIGRQEIASVIGSIQSPVVPQPLRAEH